MTVFAGHRHQPDFENHAAEKRIWIGLEKGWLSGAILYLKYAFGHFISPYDLL